MINGGQRTMWVIVAVALLILLALGAQYLFG